jgi:hypothetical protein
VSPRDIVDFDESQTPSRLNIICKSTISINQGWRKLQTDIVHAIPRSVCATIEALVTDRQTLLSTTTATTTTTTTSTTHNSDTNNNIASAIPRSDCATFEASVTLSQTLASIATATTTTTTTANTFVTETTTTTSTTFLPEQGVIANQSAPNTLTVKENVSQLINHLQRF